MPLVIADSDSTAARRYKAYLPRLTLHVKRRVRARACPNGSVPSFPDDGQIAKRVVRADYHACAVEYASRRCACHLRIARPNPHADCGHHHRSTVQLVGVRRRVRRADQHVQARPITADARACTHAPPPDTSVAWARANKRRRHKLRRRVQDWQRVAVRFCSLTATPVARAACKAACFPARTSPTSSIPRKHSARKKCEFWKITRGTNVSIWAKATIAGFAPGITMMPIAFLSVGAHLPSTTTATATKGTRQTTATDPRRTRPNCAGTATVCWTQSTRAPSLTCICSQSSAPASLARSTNSMSCGTWTRPCCRTSWRSWKTTCAAWAAWARRACPARRTRMRPSRRSKCSPSRRRSRRPPCRKARQRRSARRTPAPSASFPARPLRLPAGVHLRVCWHPLQAAVATHFEQNHTHL